MMGVEVSAASRGDVHTSAPELTAIGALVQATSASATLVINRVYVPDATEGGTDQTMPPAATERSAPVYGIAKNGVAPCISIKVAVPAVIAAPWADQAIV